MPFPFTLHLPVYLLYFDRYSVYPLPVPVSVRVPALVQLSVQVPVSSLVLLIPQALLFCPVLLYYQLLPDLMSQKVYHNCLPNCL